MSTRYKGGSTLLESSSDSRAYPAGPYIIPFAVFMALLGIQQLVSVPAWLRFAVSIAAILAVSRPALRGAPSTPLVSTAVGLAVFMLWIAPDVIAPSWRQSVLFNNSLMGHAGAHTPAALQHDPLFLVFRIAVSVAAVPVIEELFWRGWLMRWLIEPNHFERVPLGAYSPAAFWLVAALFASEHGSFWDVGLVAGIVYNLWIIRTRNLWDCIIAHAVTNGALAVWVVAGGHWQYWL